MRPTAPARPMTTDLRPARGAGLMPLMMLGVLAVAMPAGPVGTARTAEAAAPAPAAPGDDGLGGFLISPDRIFEEIAKGIRQRYNLDEDQQEIVRRMVTDYGREFVKRNGDELRALQMEGLKIAMLGGRPDAETIKDLSRRVKGLLSDAREPLKRFGDEFSEILNEDQKAVHDLERRQVALLIDVVDLELDKMIRTGELPGPGQTKPGSGQGPDGRPSTGAGAGARRFTGAGFVERQWEAYVKSFIAHYRLDADQSRRAEEMLTLAKKDAADYRKAQEKRIKEFADAYSRIREGLRERGIAADAKAKLEEERKVLDKEAEEFEAPLRDMFEKLKEALDLLPSAEQKTKYKDFPLRKLGEKKPAAK